MRVCRGLFVGYAGDVVLLNEKNLNGPISALFSFCNPSLNTRTLSETTAAAAVSPVSSSSARYVLSLAVDERTDSLFVGYEARTVLSTARVILSVSWKKLLLARGRPCALRAELRRLVAGLYRRVP